MSGAVKANTPMQDAEGRGACRHVGCQSVRQSLLCHHVVDIEHFAAQLFVLLLCVSSWPSRAENVDPVPAAEQPWWLATTGEPHVGLSQSVWDPYASASFLRGGSPRVVDVPVSSLCRIMVSFSIMIGAHLLVSGVHQNQPACL